MRYDLGSIIEAVRIVAITLAGVLVLISVVRAAIRSHSFTELFRQVRGETSVAAAGLLITGFGLSISRNAGDVYSIAGMTVAGTGLFVVASVLWRPIRKKLWGPTPFDQAEEYIATMKMAMDQANLSEVQKRVLWNNLLTKLVSEFSVRSDARSSESVISAALDRIQRDSGAS
jgi:hypothetical protein